MNGVYIRDLRTDNLSDRMEEYIPRQLNADEQKYLADIAPLVQERLKRLDESHDVTAYFFGRPGARLRRDDSGAEGHGQREHKRRAACRHRLLEHEHRKRQFRPRKTRVAA